MNPAAGAPHMSSSRPEKIILCGVGKLQKMVRQFDFTEILITNKELMQH